jgi:transglutaminase-like putative cysteine protease
MLSFGLGSLFPGDNGITQTVNAIRDCVTAGLRDPSVRLRAESVVAHCAERDEQCEVRSIFTWVLNHFRYRRDPTGLELVKGPEVSDAEITQRGFFQGDCDDVTTYLAALLKAMGYQVKVATIAIPGQGQAYRHIYPSVYLPRARQWLALEATARNKPIGWQASSDRVREYSI